MKLELPSYREMIKNISLSGGIPKNVLFHYATYNEGRLISLQRIRELHHCIEMLDMGFGYNSKEISEFLLKKNKNFKRKSALENLKSGQFEKVMDIIMEMEQI
jgi:hypothetical protein